MTKSAAHGAEVLLHRLLTDFGSTFGHSEDATVVRAPGRVNLIGDHTDYNDGFVLPITIDRDAYAVVRARRDGHVAIRASAFDAALTYALDERPTVDAGSWGSYVTGVIEELRREQGLRDGFDMLIWGDVPLGAGLSSSAALEIAVVLALDAVFELDVDPIEMALLGQTVEHQYAGVECGIMDQFVSRLGRRGHAMLLDCRTLAHQHVPFAPAKHDLTLVIADTGVSRELAGSKYGERHQECRDAVRVLQTLDASVSSLRDVDAALLEDAAGKLGEVLYRRASHVINENDRVVKAGSALRRAAFDEFGRLMSASHDSLRDLYEVSCDELDTIVSTALAVPGVYGARMTGGGFGGCAVILVAYEQTGVLESALTERYVEAYGREPTCYELRHNHQAERLFGP